MFLILIFGCSSLGYLDLLPFKMGVIHSSSGSDLLPILAHSPTVFWLRLDKIDRIQLVLTLAPQACRKYSYLYNAKKSKCFYISIKSSLDDKIVIFVLGGGGGGGGYGYPGGGGRGGYAPGPPHFNQGAPPFRKTNEIQNKIRTSTFNYDEKIYPINLCMI